MYRWASLAPAIGSGSAVAWSKDVKRIRKRQANASEAKGKGEREKMANIEQQRGKAGTPIWDWQDKGKGDMKGTTKGKVLLEDPDKVTSWLITKTSQKIRFNSWLLDLVVVDSSIACVSLCLMSHFNLKQQHEIHHENGMKSNVATRRLLKCENTSKLWHLISTRVDGPLHLEK